MSHLVETLLLHIRANKLPAPVLEHRFAAEHVGLGNGVRQRLKDADLQDWRFDLAWPEKMIAVECEGGIHSNGRHVRGKGYEGDLHKYNAAMLLGWSVARFSGGMIKNGKAIDTVAVLLSGPSENNTQ
ncbi:MAG: hypothetical protein KDA17_07885, partial [Candidatus Saccharibacteria bacterium]|nr:hypothetical protein [Candidatus Saccharibacteria bacterium]